MNLIPNHLVHSYPSNKSLLSLKTPIMKLFLAVLALAAGVCANSDLGGNSVWGQAPAHRTWTAAEVSAERDAHLQQFSRIHQERLRSLQEAIQRNPQELNYQGDVASPHLRAWSDVVERDNQIRNALPDFGGPRAPVAKWRAPVEQAHAQGAPAPAPAPRPIARPSHAGEPQYERRRVWTAAENEAERAAHLEAHAKETEVILKAVAEARAAAQNRAAQRQSINANWVAAPAPRKQAGQGQGQHQPQQWQ